MIRQVSDPGTRPRNFVGCMRALSHSRGPYHSTEVPLELLNKLSNA